MDGAIDRAQCERKVVAAIEGFARMMALSALLGFSSVMTGIATGFIGTFRTATPNALLIIFGTVWFVASLGTWWALRIETLPDAQMRARRAEMDYRLMLQEAVS